MEIVKSTKAYEYALFCANNTDRKVPKYVKKQAIQWLDIVEGNNEEAYVDEKEIKKIINILKLMIHPDLRCPMNEGLEDYAWFLIIATLCTKLKNDKNLDIRYYETALLEIARKNFKTFNSAVIFIILLITDKQFSRFYSVAPDLKLSSELKVAIRKIIKSSPLLADDEIFKVLRSEVRCLLTDSEYIPLAYSEDKMDGKLANAFLADEAGAMDDYPIEAMRSSQVTLFNKLGIIISTQYPNDNNAMLTEIDISKKVLDGLIDDERRFSLLYEPDDDFLGEDKWQSEDLIIYQANPVTLKWEHIFNAIKKKRTMAVLYENKRENYLCKHNNIKYKGLGVEGYIEITKVRECKVSKNKDFWQGKKVYLAFDLSQSGDNTAVAMVTEYEGDIYTRVWGFIPSDKVELKSKKENVDYKKLIKDGVCFACGDEVISYKEVEDFILGLEEDYGVEILQIGYDRWNALSTAQKLEAAGYEMVEIKQHSSVLHMPTKLLEEKILSKKFSYEENRLLEINFQNARVTEDTNKNKYVNKKKSEGKVDMVVALINAIYLLQQEQLNTIDCTIQVI
ncbi:MAG: terminase TerL endonuclease subunit [Clostridium celatum]|jgi:phage terminase large subunit-like protein|uniref:terminase TerL endonuclease subunit n=1 Tax=uncultured Clostridium sp. TaxID=59620 RepID=UPI000821725D|nr:terminase TerL endonuclease subunit [uncultured Clostridium sp.]MDU4979392.1 terminase TerL endonuclease subunit [Clostridium celatum]SCJ83329.1 Phage terminase-like protein%2C large subunit [uncultured Clostridium sp.]